MLDLLILAVVIIAVIAYYGRGNQSYNRASAGPDVMTAEDFALRLEYLAEMPEYADERGVYLALAKSLREGMMPVPQDSSIAAPATLRAGGANPAMLPDSFPGSMPQTDIPGPVKREKASVSETLRNINVLLYLGAFLVLVSVGIFVGVNFDVLGAGFKFSLLLLFTATFYLSGLAMDLKSHRLRPAGRTFIGIGLIALPFCGVAAYSLFEIASPYPIALATSLVALAVYIITLLLTRHTYINYLVMMSALTSVESGLLIFDFQLPVMAWAAAVVAMLFLLLGNYTKADDDSFSLGAQLLAPVSLFISFLSWATGSQSAGELGILLLLTSVFYALATAVDKNESQRRMWLGAALSLLVLAGIALLSEFDFGRSFWAAWLLGSGLAYTCLTQFLPAKLRIVMANTAAVVTGLAPVFVLDSPGKLCFYLTAVALIAFMQYRWLRVHAAALVTSFAVLILPLTVLFYWLEMALSTGAIYGFLNYLLIGLAAFYLRWYLPASSYVKQLALCVAVAAWSAGWMLTLVSHVDWVLAVSSFSLAGFVLLAAYREKQTALVGLAALLIYTGSAQVARILDIDLAITLIISGLFVYSAGFIAAIKDTETAHWCRISGVGGLLLAALLGENTYLQISGLSVASGLGGVEAKLRHSAELAYLAAGGLVLSALWLFNELGVNEAQVYAQTIALYFAGIAIHLSYRRLYDMRDVATASALFMATIPLAVQSLGSGGELRGLSLVLLSIVLVLTGLGVKYALIWRWGAVVLILEVLYQLRHVLYAVPKYVISLTLGMLLITVAIAFLLKRGDNE